MALGWKALLDRIRRGRVATEASAPLLGPVAVTSEREELPKSTVEINLGIDFGTSFTKVCFRDTGAEHSGIVRLGGDGQAIIPSVVCLAQDGRLLLKHRAPKDARLTELPFIKMRLAGIPIDEGSEAARLLQHSEDIPCRALAAWFLSNVIQQSQTYLHAAEAERLKNRRIIWSANLGVPVEHYDSPAIEIFDEVLAVAWRWCNASAMPATLSDCVQAYEEERRRPEPGATDFHAVPEIAAAVQSFVISRGALPGFYVYFDIGGGTVDGVAFNFISRAGTRRINFYSGKVGSLGLAVYKKQGRSLKGELQSLVATVIVTARQKDGRDWRKADVQVQAGRRILGRLNARDVRPLIVFLGGYGAGDRWYRETIQATYQDFQHDRAGIPPYQLNVVPDPSDLAMSTTDEFARFAIAYGLSIAFGEGPEIALPSEIEARTPPPQVRVQTADYSDSKDVYD